MPEYVKTNPVIHKQKSKIGNCVAEIYFSALLSCSSSQNPSELSRSTTLMLTVYSICSFHQRLLFHLSLVWGSESRGRVPLLPVERRRHVHHLRPAEGHKHVGVDLQPGLPLLLHLPVHLHGAVALHRPHHWLLWDHQGTSASVRC